jgi:hypothetical protein
LISIGDTRKTAVLHNYRNLRSWSPEKSVCGPSCFSPNSNGPDLESGINGRTNDMKAKTAKPAAKKAAKAPAKKAAAKKKK